MGAYKFRKMEAGVVPIATSETQLLIWYSAGAGWPAGWYFVTGNKGHYFCVSDDAACLSLHDWSTFEGAFSSPGKLPMPIVTLDHSSDSADTAKR